MTITLYESNTEKTRVNKTSSLQQVAQLQGTLRAPSSLTAPVITIELESSSIVTTFNYAFISEFNRYYFITDIIAINSKLYELHLKVDVLYSFKDDIGNLEAFIARNENIYNDYLDDNSVLWRPNVNVSEYTPTMTTGENYINITINHRTTPNYVISYISPNAVGYPTTPQVNALGPLPSVLVYSGAVPERSGVGGLSSGQCAEVFRQIYASDNLASYVKSITSYPFNVGYSLTAQYPLYLGSTLIEGVQVKQMSYSAPKRCIIADFTIAPTYHSYRDYDPYTTYEIYVPYYNYVPLKASMVLNKRLAIGYHISFEDASAECFIVNLTDNILLFTAPCQIGTSLPLNTTNAEETAQQRKSATTNMVLGTIGGAITTIVGGVTGNVPLMLGGAVAEFGSIAKGMNGLNAIYDRATAQASSGPLSEFDPDSVRVRKTTRMTALDTDSVEYTKLYGKPLADFYQISEMSGYTIVGSVHVEGVEGALSQEIDEIESLLKSGVIL